MEGAALRLEAAGGGQDSLAQHNLAHLVAHAFQCGLLGPDLLYSLLHRLCKRFSEADVALMVRERLTHWPD